MPLPSSPSSSQGQGETDIDTITVSDDAPSSPPATTAATHVVKMSLSLPLTTDEFDDEKQAKFTAAIAKATGASPADVSIDQVEAISSARRRLLASGVRIDVSIKAKDQASADVMVAGLTVDDINAELSKAGLPRAEVLGKPSTTAVSTGGSSSAEGGGGMALIIGLTVGGVIALIGIVAVWLRRKKRTSGVSVRVERARACVRALIRVHVSAYHETCNDLREGARNFRTHLYLCLHKQMNRDLVAYT